MDTTLKSLMDLLEEDEQQLLKQYLTDPEVTNETILHCEPFELLREKPYPVLEILIQQPPSSLEHIKWAIIKTFKDLLQHVLKSGIKGNFLQYFLIMPADMLREALQGEVRDLLKECLKNCELSGDFYLALLSCKDKQTVKDIMDYLDEVKFKQLDQPLDSKEYVLHQALHGPKHCLSALMDCKQDFNDVEDIKLRNNLVLLKLVHELSKIDQSIERISNIDALANSMNLDAVAEDSKAFYMQFYNDFKRLSVLVNYAKKFPEAFRIIKIEEILSASTPFVLIKKYKMLSTHSEAKAFIESYYKWHPSESKISLKEKDLELLDNYYILATVFEIVTLTTSATVEEVYSKKLQFVNSLLWQIKDFELLCQILEDIAKFVYLRWEHIDCDNQGGANTSASSHSSPDTDDDVAHDSSTKEQKKQKCVMKYVKTGFVCKAKAFAAIFNFLKGFLTKKLHSPGYKQSSQEVRQRYQKILENVKDLLWKYEFLEKMDQLQRQHTESNDDLDEEYYMNFVRLHSDNSEEASSEDDNGNLVQANHHRRLRRRKTMKSRRRATFNGTPAAPLDDLATSFSHKPRARRSFMDPSTSADAAKYSMSKDFSAVDDEERSITPKLLSSPSKLLTMAMSMKQFEDARKIIEKFDLHNSPLVAELQFLERQQLVKEKLLKICENYNQLEQQFRNANQPLATVELIRNTVAKGCEMSKIISVIENYAQTLRTEEPKHYKELIEKHKTNPQYSFLGQFEEANLNALAICDLIISMPFNLEIASNVLMVIKRHQSIQSTLNVPKSVEKSHLPAGIGPVPFLENLIECMRILGNKTIKEMLCDNIYSLKPQKLLKELEREKIFHGVFYKQPSELRTYTDLKALAPEFKALGSKYNYYDRFCNYVQNLTRLVQLRDPNCEYHVEELLKMDPIDIIGDLIFTCKIKPQEIEHLVASLNLDLAHLISLCICPEIIDKKPSKNMVRNQEIDSSILDYVSSKSELLGFLLKSIIKGGIHKDDSDATLSGLDTSFFERYMRLPAIQKLAAYYSGNPVIAALKSDHIGSYVFDQVKSKMEKLELLELDVGIQEPQPLKDQLIDSLVIELIEEDPKNIYLAYKIKDIAVRANLIYKNFTKIATARLAKEMIQSTLEHFHASQKIPLELRQNLKMALADISIFDQVSEVMQFETWPQAYDFGLKTPNAIFERLLQLRLYKLCYEWCKVVNLSENFQLQRKHFMESLLQAFLDIDDEQSTNDLDASVFDYLLKILETFPPEDCKNFLDLNKDKFRSMPLLQYTFDYLERCGTHSNIRNYKMSMLIIKQLSLSMRGMFWKLLKYPLLIIEQFIMNGKFELLSQVLAEVRKELDRLDSEPNKQKKICSFCFDKNGYIYDVYTKAPNSPHKVRFQLGQQEVPSSSAFILLNFNLYQNEHSITNDCVDLLLRIYATKSLDYHISETNSTSDPGSRRTSDTRRSLDSFDFQMPERAPTKAEWVRDEDATHCMCCKSAVFTMLIRRHHCRRCGRVVCFACSTFRMRIPELYDDVEVRVCNDCHNKCKDSNQNKSNPEEQELTYDDIPEDKPDKPEDRFKWMLSGNITHDKLVREEFCYEHAPSAGMCLSILEHHLNKQKCIDLLLFHCRKLERLIVPSPEVDFELVAKMMNCLALAAKVRGGPPEVETIREHAEIIISVVRNGCGSLIPPDPFNNNGLLRLADALVQAEEYNLALEVHLKCGWSTSGIMASHGMVCLRAGCYKTAREKFQHCIPKLTNETISSAISKIIFSPLANNANSETVEEILGLAKDEELINVKRPQSGPPLLQEILKVIESVPVMQPLPETLERASVINDSNSPLAPLLSRRKQAYVKKMNHEPALNILNTLANARRIAKGQYNEPSSSSIGGTQTWKQLFRSSLGFEECIYYLLTYGSHADILQFLMQHDDFVSVLKYYLLQKLDADMFINYIYLPSLRVGKVAELMQRLQDFNSTLTIWRSTIMQTCRYLENHSLLNSLYHLQVLLNDPVRAAMTCVKFYSMNCETFQQQHANAQHLHNARLHLQAELETAQWETINFNMPSTSAKSQKGSSRRTSNAGAASAQVTAHGGSLVLTMDGKALNSHINTIINQLEVAKFLATCELENSPDNKLITKTILKQIRGDLKTLPTLFEKGPDKIQICVLILLCGKNVEEGFGLVYRIIQYYKLSPTKVYAATAKYLACNQRLADVDKLLDCITSNNGISTDDIDEVLTAAINSAASSNNEPPLRVALDSLTKKIHSVELRISSHIVIGQLKSAYLLASANGRIGDIRKILRKAEATNQVHIKRLCEKKLQLSS